MHWYAKCETVHGHAIMIGRDASPRLSSSARSLAWQLRQGCRSKKVGFVSPVEVLVFTTGQAQDGTQEATQRHPQGAAPPRRPVSSSRLQSPRQPPSHWRGLRRALRRQTPQKDRRCWQCPGGLEFRSYCCEQCMVLFFHAKPIYSSYIESLLERVLLQLHPFLTSGEPQPSTSYCILHTLQLSFSCFLRQAPPRLEKGVYHGGVTRHPRCSPHKSRNNKVGIPSRMSLKGFFFSDILEPPRLRCLEPR